jgi:hypothetical protein
MKFLLAVFVASIALNAHAFPPPVTGTVEFTAKFAVAFSKYEVIEQIHAQVPGLQDLQLDLENMQCLNSKDEETGFLVGTCLLDAKTFGTVLNTQVSVAISDKGIGKVATQVLNIKK